MRRQRHTVSPRHNLHPRPAIRRRTCGTSTFRTTILAGWDLSQQNLTDANLRNSLLAGADLTGANLTDANLQRSALTDANLTNAVVTGSSFEATTSSRFTAAQLASTASYQTQDLGGIDLSRNNLSGWDLSGQNLTDANLRDSILANANLTGARFHRCRSGGKLNLPMLI